VIFAWKQQEKTAGSSLARNKEQKEYTAYRLGWTREEICGAIGTAQSRFSCGFLCQFPELEKSVKALLSSGLSHTEIVQRFGISPILVWAVDMDGCRLSGPISP
jgi:hypothetical protein